MKFVQDLTADDYSKIADAVISLSGKKNETELYQLMGKGISLQGLEPAPESSGTFMLSKSIISDPGEINPGDSTDFLNSLSVPSDSDSKDTGQNFWQRLKEKVHQAICSSQFIKDFIDNTGTLTLKDILTKVIPIVLSALAITALNPIVMGVVVSALALLIKIGFDDYCNI